jgi:hypothetical protein
MGLPLLYERCVAHNRSERMSEGQRINEPRQATTAEVLEHVHGRGTQHSGEAARADRPVHESNVLQRPSEDSAELRAVRGQAADLTRLHELLNLLRTKMRNKLRPEPDCGGDPQCDRPETVLDHIVYNNHHVNGLSSLVQDLIDRYQP